MMKMLSVLVFFLSTWVWADVPSEVQLFHANFTQGSCFDETSFDDSQAYDLDGGVRLYLIPCYGGAYQTTYFGYIQKLDEIRPISLLFYYSRANVVVPSFELTNATFDPKTLDFSTYSKGRGLADCGQRSLGRVEPGIMGAVTLEIQDKQKCDGQLDGWPVVYRYAAPAQVVD